MAENQDEQKQEQTPAPIGFDHARHVVKRILQEYRAFQEIDGLLELAHNVRQEQTRLDAQLTDSRAEIERLQETRRALSGQLKALGEKVRKLSQDLIESEQGTQKQLEANERNVARDHAQRLADATQDYTTKIAAYTEHLARMDAEVRTKSEELVRITAALDEMKQKVGRI